MPGKFQLALLFICTWHLIMFQPSSCTRNFRSNAYGLWKVIMVSMGSRMMHTCLSTLRNTKFLETSSHTGILSNPLCWFYVPVACGIFHCSSFDCIKLPSLYKTAKGYHEINKDSKLVKISSESKNEQIGLSKLLYDDGDDSRII